jgi:transmembrane sensor
MNRAPYEDLEVRRQRSLEEAAAWLVRLQEEEPTAAERSSFTDWLRESPLHVAAMLQVSQTEQVVKTFDGWDEVPAAGEPFSDTVVEWPTSLRKTLDDKQVSGGAPARRAHRVQRGLLAAAAACVIAMVGAGLWWEGVIGGAVFETSIGERRDVALNDGSTLRLGPVSRVRVVLSEAERDVTLVRGEALFKVAKDPGRPFIVRADRAQVRAVGTEFGVERRDGAVIVTVAEGRVAVTESASSTVPFLEGAANLALASLAAGEQLEVPHAGTAGVVRKVDSANSLAWANGRLVFENDTVSAIVQRFNQYNRIRLTVSDPQVAARRVSGSFEATDPDSFLTFLQSAVPITVVRARDGREITIVGSTVAPTSAGDPARPAGAGAAQTNDH